MRDAHFVPLLCVTVCAGLQYFVNTVNSQALTGSFFSSLSVLIVRGWDCWQTQLALIWISGTGSEKVQRKSHLCRLYLQECRALVVNEHYFVSFVPFRSAEMSSTPEKKKEVCI